MYALIHNDGIFKINDSEGFWVAAKGLPTSCSVGYLFPENDILYAQAREGMFESGDDGNSWVTATEKKCSCIGYGGKTGPSYFGIWHSEECGDRCCRVMTGQEQCSWLPNGVYPDGYYRHLYAYVYFGDHELRCPSP